MKLIMIILVLILVGIPVHAQSDFPPPVVIEGGSVVLQGRTANSTACQTGERVLGTGAVSPDGRWMLLETMPLLVQDVLEREGGIGGGALPNNYWLCDQLIGNAQPLAMQPDGASFFEPNVPDRVSAHSQPVFSPDGTHLYWTDYRFHEASPDWLVIHNRVTGERSETAIQNLPPVYGVPHPLLIAATSDTLALFGSFVTDPETFDVASLILTVDFSGVVQDRYPLGELYEPSEVLVVSASGTETFVLVYPVPDGIRLMQFDPVQKTLRERSLADLSLQNASGTLTLIPDYLPDGTLQWSLVVDGIAQTDVVGVPLTFTTRTLQAAAALPMPGADTHVLGWLNRLVEPRSGAITEPFATLLQDEDNRLFLLWSARQWNLSGEVAAITCPDFLESRLMVGQQGRVMDTTPNRIRSEPSVSGTYLGQIEGGDSFHVLDGPVCAEGYAWWYVEYGSITGWTVEGDDGEYWLEPVP